LYNGVDQDLALLKSLILNLPLIGFYGNGEIAPIKGKNELLQYSAVLGLFGKNNESI
jgi:small ligand-binding sensory domain FIST